MTAPTTVASRAGTAIVLALAFPLLAGCALNFIAKAPERGEAAAGTTIVEGRINWFLDGTSRAPYGTFRPKWLAPRFFAHRLESDTTFVSPPVNDSDGSFRWALPPGSYVLTRIGTGTYTDDSYIAWPRVALCVPAGGAAGSVAAGTARYAGHLRLLGHSRHETMVLSTGRVVTFTSPTYTFEIGDERPAAAAAGPTAGAPPSPPLWRLLPTYPIGDRFVEQMASNRAALIEQACGAASG